MINAYGISELEMGMNNALRGNKQKFKTITVENWMQVKHLIDITFNIRESLSLVLFVVWLSSSPGHKSFWKPTW